MNLRSWIVLLIAAWLAMVGPPDRRACRGDIFLLHNGGRIRGRWINRPTEPPLHYEIRTAEGGKLTLHASQVRQVIVQDVVVEEFHRRASRVPPTVDGQWQLAQWCRDNGLTTQCDACLRHILRMDPDHAAARHALGYSQVRGQWVTRREIQQQRGYQQHEGRWRLPQDIALIKKSKAIEQAERRWLAQLRIWRNMLGTEDASQAYHHIAAVRDPHSVNALALLLREETFPRVKLVYVEVLGKIATPAAVETLRQATLHDADIEVFHACLGEIVRINPPRIAKQYVEALKDDDNARVNRAAHALGRLNDRSVISPLIDALTTTHTIVIPKQTGAYTSTFVNPGPGQMPMASAPPGGTSFSAGDESKVIQSRQNNQEVLEALIKLSGVNFGFNDQAWRFWLANENRTAAPRVDWREERNGTASVGSQFPTD